MTKITTIDGDLVIRVPLRAKTQNPYMPDEDQEDMDNIVGLIVHYMNEDGQEKYYDCGFAYQIDMSYKGKSPQYSDFFYKDMGSIEDFKKLCEELYIGYVEYYEGGGII